MTDAPSYRDVIAHELRGVATPQMARALAQDIEHALESAGHCIMPMEPTEAMLEACWQATRNVSAEDRMACELSTGEAAHKYKGANRYRAMIAARPR